MNVAEWVGRSRSDALMVARCLGPFRLEDPRGSQAQFRTRKARAILAILALHGRAMSRSALADLLWSDRGSTQARASLRQTIFELQHLDWRGVPLLAAGRDDISTDRRAVASDLELIRTACANESWAELLGLLERSEPGLLTDLDGLDPELDDWLRSRRAHEPAKTLSGVVEAADRCAGAAGPKAALEILAEVLRLDPANEEATRLAMRLSHEMGDRGGVHRHFAALRDRLHEDYHTEPSAETLALFSRVGNGQSKAEEALTRSTSEPASTNDIVIEPGPARRHLSAIFAMAALALIAIVSAVVWHSALGQSAAGGKVIVAVLPFEQQPPDGSFLAAGLWEQTRGALTRNTSISVLGRATTEAMAAQKLAPDGFRRRFGVTHVLEGTVRRSGNDLLVSVSLTRTSDGVAVWQDAFRGRLGEPFGLQDAIANGIEGKLRAQLAPEGGRRAEQIATSPEVYALYSEARQLNASRTEVGFARAEALMREAVKRDPNYAPAWSLLGASIYFNGRRAIVDADRRAEAIGDVQHALSLAPNFAPAHATLALIEGEQSQMAEAPLRRAVALDPSYSEAWNWLGNSLNRQGRLREAIAAYQRAIAIDPLLYPAVINLFNTASDAGDQAAISRLLRTITKAGASGDLIVSLNAEQAYRRGDFSASLKLLRDQGLDGDRHSKPMVWSNWFDSLTALGLYGDLHRITGCPEWYAPLVSGEALPPTSYGGKAVTPEEFWTSMFFSAPASRAMVRLGKSRDLVRLYRQAYRNADDFILQADRRDMLPELAPNLASALRADGSAPEASYVLAASSERLERALSRSKGRDSLARLARIRAAQGEKEQAVTLLDAALRRGWFPDGRSTTLDLAQEPAFDRLRGDARFEALRQRVLDHVAKERAELRHLQV